jgi:hypothetical protein
MIVRPEQAIMAAAGRVNMSKFLLTVWVLDYFYRLHSPRRNHGSSIGRRAPISSASKGKRANRLPVSSLPAPDCTASGDVTVRVTKQPEHGTVETVATTGYAHFSKENIRSKCNQHKVKGTLVNYKAAEKYTGNDEFDLLILLPGGLAWELHFDIGVR